MDAKCNLISGQLSELLNYTVVCKYDEPENLFYAQIFNVVFDRFDEVESKVFDYSNANYEQLGAFCIPVMFSPEQTRECSEHTEGFPADSTGNEWHSVNATLCRNRQSIHFHRVVKMVGGGAPGRKSRGRNWGKAMAIPDFMLFSQNHG